jgi:PAS domain S-box-containing protein
MKLLRILSIVLAMVVSVFSINAQAQGGGTLPNNLAQRLRFERFPLDSNTVVSILQDSQGFMWFATELGGVYQYDGYTFTSYRHDSTNSNSLAGNAVRVIYEDRAGALWFGTDSGLNKFDRETRQFNVYRHNPNDPHSLSNDFIFSIYEDRAGVFWIGPIAGGLNRFDRKTGQFSAYRNDPNDPYSLSGNHVWVIYEDRFGTLWVGTNNGLNKFDQATGQFTRYQYNPDDPYSLSQNFVMTLYEDQDGTFWVGTRGGLNKLDRATGRFTRYLNDPNDATSLSHNLVRTFLKDQTGRIWIGTDDKLNRLNEAGRFVHYQHEAVDPNSLSTNLIQYLYQDRTGAIWIGTYNGGVNRLDPAAARFALYQDETDNPDSLSNNNVSVIYEDRAGMLWIGTNGGGLDRLDRTTEKFTHYQYDPKNPDSLGGNTIKAVFEDSAGMLWIGLFRGGLDRFDPRTGKFSHYRSDPKNPDSLSNDDVRAVYEDRTGVLWIGTYSGGLNRLDRETGKFTRYLPDPQKPDSLGSENIIGFLEDRTGTLWLRTFDAGLVKFDRVTETFTHYRYDINNPSSLSNNQVSMIYADRAGTFWVGTLSGLNRFDPDNGTFVRYGEKDGLANDTIQGILEDDQSYLWISTNKGLARFDPRTETFRNYDVTDGLQSNAFNGGAGGIATCKSRTGELFFGGPNGFNAFYPDRLRDNPYIPPVVLTEFQIFNKPVPIGGKGSPLQKHINETVSITLSYAQSVFSFGFAALNYRSPEKNRYAYKMEGFEKDWNYVDSTRRFATYTNLDYGTYTFRVKASNNDGVWNEVGKTVKITITPPWWQTWWFYTMCVIGVLGIFGLIYQSKTNQLRAERAAALALRESEERFRSIFSQSPIGIELYDQAGQLIDANPVCLDMFGVKNLEVIKGFKLFEDPNLPEDTKKRLRTGELVRYEIVFDFGLVKQHHLYETTKSGQSFLEIFLTQWGASPDEPRGFLVHVTDITERKRVEVEREKLIAELEAKSAELERFTYTVSHDLKSPLVTVRGFLGFLEQDAANGDLERLQKDIQRIREATDTMHQLLNELLELSRIGRVINPPQELVFAELVQEALERLASRIAEYGVQVVVGSPLPRVSGDRPRLVEVVQNLVENAIKFMGDQPEPRIEIGVQRCDEETIFFVADNGIGIAPQYHEKIFGLFERLDPEIDGTGVGLALVKRIIKLHRGRIWVESEGPRQGSTFYFTVSQTQGGTT